MKILIANNKSSKISELEQEGGLWVLENELTAATGFELKSSGACYPKLDICIPLFENDFTYEDEDGKWLNISKLAKTLDMALVSNKDDSVWSLGIIPQEREHLLNTGMAPNIKMVDIHGKSIRLSNFRGKKVLIVTWATWCGCRFDVKSWQKIYEELNDPNFEIICVAEDSQGEAVARKWFDDAKASFHCIVDAKHAISSAFGWVNVPTGCWIDEEGKIVRVNEAAYAEKHQIDKFILKTEFGSDAFGIATKEWVRNGLNPSIAQDIATRNANIKSTSQSDYLADAWFQLGLYFQEKEALTEAELYFENARKLAPNNWNIARQSWTFKSTFYAIKNWNRITRSRAENDNWSYYQPMDLKGAPNRQTTRIEFLGERIEKWCKSLTSSQ